jgi:hypothetical protein
MSRTTSLRMATIAPRRVHRTPVYLSHSRRRVNGLGGTDGANATRITDALASPYTRVESRPHHQKFASRANGLMLCTEQHQQTNVRPSAAGRAARCAFGRRARDWFRKPTGRRIGRSPSSAFSPSGNLGGGRDSCYRPFASVHRRPVPSHLGLASAGSFFWGVRSRREGLLIEATAT